MSVLSASTWSGKWGRFGGTSAGSSDDGLSMRGLTPSRPTSGDLPGLPVPHQQQLSHISQWSSEMDTIDKQQEQLVSSQWKLLRSQIGSLSTSMSEIRNELAQLKGNVASKEVEPVIERMVEAHNGHELNHTSLLERLGYLETFLSETVEKQSKELAEAQIAHEKTKEECFQGVQDLIEKQATELVNIQQHSQLDIRVEHLQQLVQELVAKHDKQVAESSENHRKELADQRQTIEARFGSMEAVLSKLNDAEAPQRSTILGLKTELLETMKGYPTLDKLAELGCRFDNFRESTQTQLTGMESSLENFDSKIATGIGELRSKVGDVHSELGSCARKDGHNSLEQRLGRLERSLGECNSKHDKALAEHKIEFTESSSILEAHIESVRIAASECSSKLEARVEKVKAVCENDLDSIAKQIKDTSTRMGSIETSLKQCVKSEHHSSLENSVQTRIDVLETALRDACDTHARVVAETKTNLQALEIGVGESTTKRVDETAAMETRLQKMEHAVSVQHALQIESTQSKLMQLECDMKNGFLKRITHLEEKRMIDLADHKACIEFHKESIERRLVGIESKHDNFEASILNYQGVENRVIQLGDKQLKDVEDIRAQLHNAVQERLGFIEQQQSDSNEISNRQFAALEGSQNKLRTQCEELGISFRSETSARDGRHEDIEKKIANLQVIADGSVTKDAENKLRDVLAKVDQQRSALETHRLVIERRCENLETRVFHGSEDFTKELEQRVAYMQEDIKRQREIMEASLLEQLRQEHATIISQASVIKEQWDREVKARQAYMESYKELLAQERAAREKSESALEGRIEAFGRKLDEKSGSARIADGFETSSDITQPGASSVTVPPPQPDCAMSAASPPFKSSSFEPKDHEKLVNGTSPRHGSSHSKLQQSQQGPQTPTPVAPVASAQLMSGVPSPPTPTIQSRQTLQQSGQQAGARLSNPRSPQAMTRSPRQSPRMLSVNGTRVAGANSAYMPTTSSVRMSPATSNARV